MQETGRQRYYRQIREIRDTLDIPHNEARDRWGDFYAPGGESIKSVQRLHLAIRACLGSSMRCPLCLDDIFADDQVVCERCKSAMHPECFDELGSVCPTLGCATRRMTRRARQRILIQPQDTAPHPSQDLIDEHEYLNEIQEARLRRNEIRAVTPVHVVLMWVILLLALVMGVVLGLGLGIAG